MTDRVVVATANRGKVAELGVMLSDALPTTSFITQSELGVGSIAETGLTFVENAILKARHACSETGLPAIADDSGLVVPALGGAPGLYSARYAGEPSDDKANLEKLLLELEGEDDRRAFFQCVMVYLTAADDPSPLIADGRWFGEIALAPRGEGGFGYDPVFFVPPLGATAAELDAPTKNRKSHRGIACRRLTDALIARRDD